MVCNIILSQHSDVMVLRVWFLSAMVQANLAKPQQGETMAPPHHLSQAVLPQPWTREATCLLARRAREVSGFSLPPLPGSVSQGCVAFLSLCLEGASRGARSTLQSRSGKWPSSFLEQLSRSHLIEAVLKSNICGLFPECCGGAWLLHRSGKRLM